MHYFSTKRNSPNASFREAVLHGQASDGGLFFPSVIPKTSRDFIANLNSRSNDEIAFEVILPFLNDEIPEAELFDICADTVNFPFPLVSITERISALELFHGPTMAFKDVGARFMSRCLKFFSQNESRKMIVIVATSGDTGGAVAAGFHGMEGIDVVILYPKGRVSRVQELQLTTLGGNVTTLEVRGSFDDCQSLAKTALADAEFSGNARFTSANSINVARWLPQQFYYWIALKNWDGEPPIFSVPSGNFGNLAAGLIAYASGLPAKAFIAACNANDVLPRFFETGEFVRRASVATLSNAMDVGDPSNFERVLEIFGREVSRLKKVLTAVTVSDTQTQETMKEVFENTSYVLDPHGAVGFRALADGLASQPSERGIFLETAHPVKFESVEATIGNYEVGSDIAAKLNDGKKESIEIDPDYNDLREILSKLI
jgi:threonine synthase